jgi:hypothetical protein
MNVLTPTTILVLLHAFAVSAMRIVFVEARPTPASWSEHVSVSVQCNFPEDGTSAYGPDTWNFPIWNT